MEGASSAPSLLPGPASVLCVPVPSPSSPMPGHRAVFTGNEEGRPVLAELGHRRAAPWTQEPSVRPPSEAQGSEGRRCVGNRAGHSQTLHAAGQAAPPELQAARPRPRPTTEPRGGKGHHSGRPLVPTGVPLLARTPRQAQGAARGAQSLAAMAGHRPGEQRRGCKSQLSRTRHMCPPVRRHQGSPCPALPPPLRRSENLTPPWTLGGRVALPCLLSATVDASPAKIPSFPPKGRLLRQDGI